MTHDTTNSVSEDRELLAAQAERILDDLNPEAVDLGKKSAAHSSNQRVGMSGAAKGFWGTLIVFAIVTIGLTIAAELNKRDNTAEASAPVEEQIPPEIIRPIFEVANKTAIEETLKKAEELVRAAFAPTYERLPAYVDWHYSVWGSYEELVDGAKGAPTEELTERVFFDVDEKLSVVASDLDEYYEKIFEETSLANFEALEGPAAGVIANTQSSLLGAIGQKSLVVISLAGAKKVGPAVAALAAKKVAATFAAKMGTKWLATLGGLTTGTAACVWAGPGASVCGVVGAAAVWIGFDYGAVKLDEYITRDSFTDDLEMAIEESIEEQLHFFEAQIKNKSELKKRDISDTMQEFTLEQLYESDKLAVCRAGEAIVNEYNVLRVFPTGRPVDRIVSLEKVARDQQKILGLFELSTEILKNLNGFQNIVEVTPVSVYGALHPDLEASRSISGTIRLNGTSFRLEKTSYDNRFSTTVVAEEGEKAVESIYVPAQTNLKIVGKLEQHLYFRNRHLSAVTDVVHSEIGKEGSVSLIFYEDDAYQPSYAKIKLKVEPEPLQELYHALECDD